MQDDALSVLEDVMNQIFARKAESVPPIPYVPNYQSYMSLPHSCMSDRRRSACAPA